MDGRHARRERGERAVINALFELLEEGNLAPAVEEVGARAGVSVATIFRNHGNLDELARHAAALFGERFGALFRIHQIGQGPLPERIARFCDARLRLFDATWPLVRFMKYRAVKHPEAAENLERLRAALATQVQRQFAPELRRLAPAEAQDVAALLDTLSAPEAWALMQSAHGRSPRQIKRAWSRALNDLLHAGE